MPTRNDVTAPLLTWKLTPQKLLNSLWAFSTYRGEVYVRAPDEESARGFAAAQFANDPARTSPNSPWLFEVFTTAEVVDDERFASITAPGVVFTER